PGHAPGRSRALLPGRRRLRPLLDPPTHALQGLLAHPQVAPRAGLHVLADGGPDDVAATGARQPALHVCLLVRRPLAMVDGAGHRRRPRAPERLEAPERRLALVLARSAARRPAGPPHSPPSSP